MLQYNIVNDYVDRQIIVRFYKRDKLTGEWRNLHNEELYDLYSSPSIIRMIKSRRAGHVARMGQK
jgi:hypothetical protein